MVLKNVISEPQATHYILITQNTRVRSIPLVINRSSQKLIFCCFCFFVGVKLVKLKIRTYVALKNVSSFFHMIKHPAT